MPVNISSNLVLRAGGGIEGHCGAWRERRLSAYNSMPSKAGPNIRLISHYVISIGASMKHFIAFVSA